MILYFLAISVCVVPMMQSSGGLSDADIEKMVKDAELFAAKDKERKALIEVKNDADTTLYSVERSLNEHKDKLPTVCLERSCKLEPLCASPATTSPLLHAVCLCLLRTGRGRCCVWLLGECREGSGGRGRGSHQGKARTCCLCPIPQPCDSPFPLLLLLCQDVVDAVSSSLEDLKKALEGEDVEAIKEKVKAARDASLKIGETLAKSAGGGSSSSGSDGGAGKGSTSEAEYEEASGNEKK